MQTENHTDSVYDLETYVNNYSNHGKVRRLQFILLKHKGDATEAEAFKLLAYELRKTKNTALYRELLNGRNESFGVKFDEEWVQSTDQQAAMEESQLQQELSASQANLIKESIRQSLQLLGDFYYDRGDLQRALKSYTKSRDYCSTSSHTLDMCLRIIKVSLELEYYPQCSSFCEKAFQITGIEGNKVAYSKIQVARALVALDKEDYQEVALRLCDVQFEMEDQFNEVICGQDVALIAAICGLSTFSRASVKTLLLYSSQMKQFLELMPDARFLVMDYFHGRYHSLLMRLQNIVPLLAEDIYLSKHLKKLYLEIRNRCLIQYAQPYVAVDLHAMASAFDCLVGDLIKDLSYLIRDGKIIARIDSQAQVMFARHHDIKNVAYHNAVKSSEEFIKRTKEILMRCNLIKYSLIQGPEQFAGIYQNV
eukprot:TRINITY_DN2758_c0_g2_i1.p1 TRINITY_DN2758_c0_g2~~TRINITY_DN2758_c0_g2_i1.p1  ORF type:complete len:423 (-),score=24.21 TRINITY_DN2758_c0_g2_i1:134-1402(-)